jgi:hypothetical protein
MSRGSELIDQLKDHVLATMRSLPECGPGGEGARGSEIEKLADIDLKVTKSSGWLAWTLLERLVLDGQVVESGYRSTHRFHLAR